MTLQKLPFVIPARMASSRLPGKVLKGLGPRTVLDWVIDNCGRSRYCSSVIVGTDSSEIRSHCEVRGAPVHVTGEHNCCSNRTAEVARTLESEWVVEVQSDEPFLWASHLDHWLDQAVRCMASPDPVDVFLSYSVIPKGQEDETKFVKIVRSSSGRILWASRSKLPSGYKAVPEAYFCHTGLYLWRRDSLIRFSKIEPGLSELSEDTHAMRLFEHFFDVSSVFLAPSQSVDVPEDLVAAERYLRKHAQDVARETGVALTSS